MENAGATLSYILHLTVFESTWISHALEIPIAPHQRQPQGCCCEQTPYGKHRLQVWDCSCNAHRHGESLWVNLFLMHRKSTSLNNFPRVRILPISQLSTQITLEREEEFGPCLSENSKSYLQVPMRWAGEQAVFLYNGLHSKILFLRFQVRSKEQHTGP